MHNAQCVIRLRKFKMATPQTDIYYHFYDKDGKEVNEQAKAKIIICTVKDKNGIEQEIQSLY